MNSVDDVKPFIKDKIKEAVRMGQPIWIGAYHHEEAEYNIYVEARRIEPECATSAGE